VSSQSPQPTPVIAPVQSPCSPCPRSDLVLSPEASPRAKQGHLEKRPCPKGCGRLFKPGNMTQHLPTSSGKPHAAQEQKKKAEAAMSRRLEARKQSSDPQQATIHLWLLEWRSPVLPNYIRNVSYNLAANLLAKTRKMDSRSSWTCSNWMLSSCLTPFVPHQKIPPLKFNFEAQHASARST